MLANCLAKRFLAVISQNSHLLAQPRFLCGANGRCYILNYESRIPSCRTVFKLTEPRTTTRTWTHGTKRSCRVNVIRECKTRWYCRKRASKNTDRSDYGSAIWTFIKDTGLQTTEAECSGNRHTAETHFFVTPCSGIGTSAVLHSARVPSGLWSFPINRQLQR